MPKLHSIIKVEKKEKFWWQKEFQYLLDRKILSRDELAYLFGQIKSIIEQENNLIGNKSVGLDENEMGLLMYKTWNPKLTDYQAIELWTARHNQSETKLMCAKLAKALITQKDKIIIEKVGVGE